MTKTHERKWCNSESQCRNKLKHLFSYRRSLEKGIWISALVLPSQIITDLWLKTTEVYFLMVLKTRCPNSRCWQDYTLYRGSRGESVLFLICSIPYLFCSLSSFHRLPASLVCGHIIPIFASVFTGFLLCVSLLQGCLPLDLGLDNLGWSSHFKILNFICKYYFSKEGDIHRFWSLGCGPTIFWCYHLAHYNV